MAAAGKASVCADGAAFVAAAVFLPVVAAVIAALDDTVASNVSAAEVGTHPDLWVGPPTATVFPTNDRKYKKSQFFEKFFEKI